MSQVPQNLEEAIEQAKVATLAALEAGCDRIQVEFVIPEIALQAQSLALQFSSLFEEYGSGLRVLFPDTGAAALACRDWGETIFKISDLGSRFIPVDNKISEEDTIYLVVCPSSVEVNAVEKLCNLAGTRPVILLIPQLEDVSVVGIGLAARQLRERFVSTLESAYYLRSLEGAVVLRSFPSLWQVWLEKEEGYELIAQEPQKPAGEALELLLIKATSGTSDESGEAPNPKPKKAGLLTNMQRFLRALSQ
jgi:hypothetical protein